MDAALADIAAGLGEGFAELMLYVSEHPLSEADVVAVRRLVDTAELVCTHTVAKFATGAEFRELGMRDVGSWLAAKTGARRTEGHARCEQARVLEDLPEVASAVLAGTFSAAHLRCLSANVNRKRLEFAKRDQAVFVDAASRLDASQFSQVMQRWVALADDELSDPNQPGGADRQFDGRRLQLSQMLDGMWRLNGVFDPVAGEAIDAVLASITPRPSPDDPRTPGQRRADGFLEWCQSFLADPNRVQLGNERPNVNVVLHAADGSAQTTGGWFLRNWQLSQVMCDATLTAVATTLKGAPFDVGTPLSAIPARNRKAVVVRDRCCRFPHCSRPASRNDRAVSGGIAANPKGGPQGCGARFTTFVNGKTSEHTSCRIWFFCAHTITERFTVRASSSAGKARCSRPRCLVERCSMGHHTRLPNHRCCRCHPAVTPYQGAGFTAPWYRRDRA